MKKSISTSIQVRRVIFGEDSGTDWRTAWYICHRWRAAMKGDAFALTGTVEVDETYIGGKDRNRHFNKKSAQVRKAKGPQPLGDAVGYGKVGVVGAIARKGNVVCKVIGGMGAETLTGFVRNTVDSKVTLLATDEKDEYRYVDQRMRHEAVKQQRWRVRARRHSYQQH